MNEDLKHVDVLPPAVRQYVEQLVGRAMMDRFGIEVTGTEQDDRAADVLAFDNRRLEQVAPGDWVVPMMGARVPPFSASLDYREMWLAAWHRIRKLLDRPQDAGEALEGATVDELLAALVSHPDLALDEYGLKANRDVALGLDIARVLAKHL